MQVTGKSPEKLTVFQGSPLSSAVLLCLSMTSALTTHTTTISRTPTGAGIGTSDTSYAALFGLDEGMHGRPHNNKQDYDYDHICHLLFLSKLLH